MAEHNDQQIARNVIEQEIEGLKALQKTFGAEFSQAIDKIIACKGRVVVAGMGKSGHVARKIAATLASTGTPAMFVHPAEASHGDLGMITKKDVVILLSNSGETIELKDIIEHCVRFHIPLIGIARRRESMLVHVSTMAFVLPDVPEASAVLAPTTSTTMMMAWGDALAMAILERRGFSQADFRTLHPGGKLGKTFLRIENVMRKADQLPIVREHVAMSDALIEMTSKGLGCVVVVNAEQEPVGIVTDGDLRRHMSKDLLAMSVEQVMTKKPRTVAPTMLAVEAMSLLNDRKITTLLVADKKKLVGILHIHDLLAHGIS